MDNTNADGPALKTWTVRIDVGVEAETEANATDLVGQLFDAPTVPWAYQGEDPHEGIVGFEVVATDEAED